MISVWDEGETNSKDSSTHICLNILSESILIHTVHIKVLPIIPCCWCCLSLSMLQTILLVMILFKDFFIFSPHLQIFWEDIIFCNYFGGWGGGGDSLFLVWVYGSKLCCSKKDSEILINIHESIKLYVV